MNHMNIKQRISQKCEGRIARVDFLARSVGYAAACTIISWVLFALAMALREALPPSIQDYPILLVLLVAIPYSYWYTVLVRRLHDINLSGWYGLIVIVLMFLGTKIAVFSIAYLLVVLALLLVPGTKDTNKYGEPPKS